MARTLQRHLPRIPKTENHRSAPNDHSKVLEQALPNRQRAWNSPPPTQLLESSSSSNILGPDSCLTTMEHNRQMSLGLCLRCGQSGYLARSCPKQAGRNPAAPGAQAAYIEPSSTAPEETKKEVAVVLLPRESTA